MSAVNFFKMSVLVIDDDTIFHFITQKMLLRLGVMPEFIQTALSGQEAIDRLAEHQRLGIPLPDFILLDLNMPMMNGFDFLKAFRNFPNHDHDKTRIIMISSSLDNRDVDRALQLGANQFLTKPVNESALKEVLGQP
jgi:CheY-like chemotaxis protein